MPTIRPIMRIRNEFQAWYHSFCYDRGAVLQSNIKKLMEQRKVGINQPLPVW